MLICVTSNKVLTMDLYCRNKTHFLSVTYLQSVKMSRILGQQMMRYPPAVDTTAIVIA